jgi:DNA-binding protein H-NS
MAPKTYRQLQNEIADLQAQAEQLRQQEIAAVIVEIKEKIGEYGLSVSQIFGSAKVKLGNPAARNSVAAKFRDPASGNTWSGRGRTPKWLEAYESAGRKREDFSAN